MRRLLQVAVPLLLAGPVAAPLALHAQDLPVTECAQSPSALPAATEGVAYDASVLTSTSPGLAGMSASGLPAGLTLVDRFVRGTPTAVGNFTVTLKKVYRTACGKMVPAKPGEETPPTYLSAETLTLTVRDGKAPVVSSFQVTPATLPASGGGVTLTVQAADAGGVGRVMMTTRHPDGHTGSAVVPLTAGTAAGGTWSISFALGGNAAPAPASYSFTVAVSDAAGHTTSAGPATVVVAAPVADPVLRLRPPLRP